MAENPQVPEVNAPPKPQQHEKYPWPAEPTLVGKRIQRLDGPVKVTGQAKYSYDINRPGGLHGRILRSPHPHARIVAIDLTAAQKAPGVKAVMAVLEPGAKVMFQGEEVAALAAATEEQADDALRLIARAVRSAAPHRHRGAGDARRRAAGVQGRQHQGRRHRRSRRSRRGLQGRRACRGSQLRHAGADARLARDARLRLRVGGRQADLLGVHSSRARHARAVCQGPRHPAGQRSRHHRVHGRRLRQQVRPRCAGHHLREAGQTGWRGRQAAARPQGRAPGVGQPALVGVEDQGGRERGRDADGI